VSTIATSDGGAFARRSIIATAGHVDHGKTALIRALTGVDTDRLAEEKRRGITIELGFAELPGAPVSFIDVPGHRRLVHTMIAGASGVDALLLAVAADDGVMPQTREHLRVAELLGVRHVLVALTKSDLADDERRSRVEEDVRRTVAALRLDLWTVVHTSARSGEGLGALRTQLLSLAGTLPPKGRSARAVVAIDRVFTIRGAGLVVTGTLVRGSLRVGQSIHLRGRRGSRDSACRGLENHGRAVHDLEAPARVAVNLARLDKEDVERGDVLCSHADVPITRRLDVSLRNAPSRPLRDDVAAVLHCGTARTAARVKSFDRYAHITLAEPIAAIGGTAFVLRGFADDPDDGAVLGGGLILDASPEALPRRREHDSRARRARALEHCVHQRFTEAVIAMMDDAVRPLHGASLERRLGLEPDALASLLVGVASLVHLPGGCYTTERAVGRLTEVAVERVRAHHDRAPHERGASLETVRAALAERAGLDAAEAALRRVLEAGRLILVDQRSLATPDFVKRGHPVSDDAANAVLEALERASFRGVEEAAFPASGTPLEVARTALARLAAEARARRLGPLWFAESVLVEARKRVRECFERRRSLSVPEFKELCGVTRKQAIPLLEQLDREGMTRRDREHGDVRLAGPLLRE
jgi:selenocysteine-specific elongation factor